MNLDRTGYSGRIYQSEGLREHAEFVLKTLDKLHGKFDFVAVTGKSGLAVAFAALAMGADFDLVTIRKGESSHGSEVEGKAQGNRYVVVDDLIDTGATLDRIHERLVHFHHTGYGQDPEQDPVMVAAVLYGGGNRGGSWKVSGQYTLVKVFAQ